MIKNYFGNPLRKIKADQNQFKLYKMKYLEQNNPQLREKELMRKWWQILIENLLKSIKLFKEK